MYVGIWRIKRVLCVLYDIINIIQLDKIKYICLWGNNNKHNRRFQYEHSFFFIICLVAELLDLHHITILPSYPVRISMIFCWFPLRFIVISIFMIGWIFIYVTTMLYILRCWRIILYGKTTLLRKARMITSVDWSLLILWTCPKQRQTKNSGQTWAMGIVYKNLRKSTPTDFFHCRRSRKCPAQNEIRYCYWKGYIILYRIR